MKFTKAPLPGAFLIDLEPRSDERGFFARSFCSSEFAAQGLVQGFVQANTAFTAKRGTFRGLHYQLPPSAEVKLVRCVRGAIHDVIVDIRPESPTFRRWFGADLTADNRTMMYVPQGFAHGLITLTDDVEVHYLVSTPYDGVRERGLRYNDPAFGLKLPIEPISLSGKDAGWPDLDATFHGLDLLRGLV
jgi:dTDP-4-dehydrorhamnose 3,5-epimerase